MPVFLQLRFFRVPRDGVWTRVYRAGAAHWTQALRFSVFRKVWLLWAAAPLSGFSHLYPVQYVAPLRDTIVVYDTVSIFRWSDRWVKAEGAISNGEVECKVESIDTLRQVIHRVPRRFGLIRYGTKAIRQEITSSNPHSQIVYTEYIELPKRREKR